MKALIAALAAAFVLAGPALADPVALKANPTDADGQVTLGDVFENAGAAAGVAIGRRAGPSVVFEAGQLQMMARQAGLDWSNPTGLRRVVVRDAAFAPGAAAVPRVMAEAAETVAAPVMARPSPTQRVIARNDIVEVAYEVGGVRLTVSGRAEGAAAVGQRLAIRNLQSNKVFDAVAVAPGQALAGPAGQNFRAQQSASR